MKIPTKEQLALLYPNIDPEYINDYITRQLYLIEMEKDKIGEVDAILNNALQLIVNKMNEQVQSSKRDYYTPYDYLNKKQFIESIQPIIEQLKVDLVEFEVDGLIQAHETSSTLYQWILEKYFVDNYVVEIGGEQKANPNKVTKKQLTKAKAQEIVGKTVSKKTVGDTIDEVLNQFTTKINRLYDEWTTSKSDKTPLSKAVNQTKSAFKEVSDTIKRTTRKSTQQTVYDAVNDVDLTVSDDYEIVYYRVEVLDTDICLLCLNLDGQINNSPLGLVHMNCRGIDMLLLRDSDGKYHDTNGKKVGHKMKTQSFETKFSKMSQKQQRYMLGKKNFEYFKKGKLAPNDFLSYDRKITVAEAEAKIAMKSLRSKITSPKIAGDIAKTLEQNFPSIDTMDAKQLLSYEKVLGYQKQLYNLVPNKNFGKKSKQEYIDSIDAKFVKVLQRRSKL